MASQQQPRRPPVELSPRQRAELMRRQAEMQHKLTRHVDAYPVRLAFPANVHAAAASGDGEAQPPEGQPAPAASAAPPPVAGAAPPAPPKPLRTDGEFIQARLIEAGVPFEVDDDDLPEGGHRAQTAELGRITDAVSRFADDLRSTGCYESASVVIGRAAPAPSPAEGAAGPRQAERRQLDVILEEKNWYRLYVGGGLGAKDLSSGSASGPTSGGSSDAGASFDVPKVRLETTASLLNLTGKCDATVASYSVDQTGAVNFGVTHDRPLYTVFPPTGPLAGYRDLILNHPGFNGTRMGMQLRAEGVTDDHERTRSCREYTRLVGVRLNNYSNSPLRGVDGPLKTLDWSASVRDVVPRRHPTLPYCCDASPEVVAQTGSSLKHAASVSYATNGLYTDDRFNPTAGFDVRAKAEIAGPPGDVGFVKVEGGAALHVPLGGSDDDDNDGGGGGNLASWLLRGASLHLTANAGALHPLTFGGLCPSNTALPDRFHLGGPLNLRGFLPCGVGPRSSSRGGKSTPGGDALGGDFYCSSTLAASVPFPAAVPSVRNAGVRIIGFANAGTLIGGLPLGSKLGSQLLGPGTYISPLDAARSVRASAGVGLAGTMPGGVGRFEVTYAIPLRYGPRDATRRVQFGMGMSFG